MDWLIVAVQAGGAISVCGMFIWFLINKQKADKEERDAMMSHLQGRDEQASEDRDKQMAYLQVRDVQSKEIALSGHAALHDVATEVSKLREEIIKNKA